MTGFREQLSAACRGKVCILGMGNRSRGDEGAGSWLIDRVAGYLNADCIDGDVAPESFIEKVVELAPDVVFVVAAADFKGMAGDVRLFEPEDVVAGVLPTHAVALEMLCDEIKERASAVVHVIAIQPESVEPSDCMTDIVEASVNLLAEQLLERLPGV